MDMENFIAIDVETSGFGPSAQILEIGVVHFWRGKVVRRWGELVCPMGLTWTDEGVKQALAVNGLNIEALMYGANTFSKVRHRLELEIGEPLWVAHNAMFERTQLLQEYKRLGMDAMPFMPELFVCTKELDLLINPGLKGHKLGDLTERWQTPGAPTHRALDDAEACGHVFAAMLERCALPWEHFKAFYERKQTLQWYRNCHGL